MMISADYDSSASGPCTPSSWSLQTAQAAG